MTQINPTVDVLPKQAQRFLRELKNVVSLDVYEEAEQKAVKCFLTRKHKNFFIIQKIHHAGHGDSVSLHPHKVNLNTPHYFSGAVIVCCSSYKIRNEYDSFWKRYQDTYHTKNEELLVPWYFLEGK